MDTFSQQRSSVELYHELELNEQHTSGTSSCIKQGLLTVIKPGAETMNTHDNLVAAAEAGATWQAMCIITCS
jgi:hypothetical protein